MNILQTSNLRLKIQQKPSRFSFDFDSFELKNWHMAKLMNTDTQQKGKICGRERSFRLLGDLIGPVLVPLLGLATPCRPHVHVRPLLEKKYA